MVIEIFSLVAAGTLLLLFCYVAIVSLADGEKRAAAVGAVLAIVAPSPYLLVYALDAPFQEPVGVILAAISTMAVFLLFFPFRSNLVWDGDTPRGSIDERDIMFSRSLLQPGTARFDEYYSRHPEKKDWDDKFRSRPGLLATGATQYDPLTFRAAAASFDTIERLRPFVDGDPASEKIGADRAEITKFIKSWTLKLGAHSVGVAELREYHKYSVIGRGPEYGKEVALDHEYAIALTVEMDRRMLQSGPKGPTVMESAQMYVDSGTIAVQVARFLRNLGYNARAHIDGNYRVVCPLVARDAGLGEIGRMGILMTPDLGPRVRIAVVTTDIPLEVDQRTPDHSVLDFCTHCRKCAISCPPWAIPFDDWRETNGVKRWQIKQELCYIYWTHTGTDCGRCVAVCPYSHSSRLFHNLVRWGVRRSAVFRRAAVFGDELLYGRRPRPAPVPCWMPPQNE